MECDGLAGVTGEAKLLEIFLAIPTTECLLAQSLACRSSGALLGAGLVHTTGGRGRVTTPHLLWTTPGLPSDLCRRNWGSGFGRTRMWRRWEELTGYWRRGRGPTTASVNTHVSYIEAGRPECRVLSPRFLSEESRGSRNSQTMHQVSKERGQCMTQQGVHWPWG